MRFSDTKEFYFETFGFVTVETFWLEGLIEIKPMRNSDLLYKTIESNHELINSILFKIDNVDIDFSLKLEEVIPDFSRTKVSLNFNMSFLNEDILRKLIYLILKIDVDKDTTMIADVLLNNGKENFIYKVLIKN